MWLINNAKKAQHWLIAGEKAFIEFYKAGMLDWYFKLE